MLLTLPFSLREAFERRGVPTTAFEAFKVCIQTRLGLQDKAEPAQQEDQAQTTINEPTTAQMLSSEPLRSAFDDPHQKGVKPDTDNGEVAVSPLPDGAAGYGEGDDDAFDMVLHLDRIPDDNPKQRQQISPVQKPQQTFPVEQRITDAFQNSGTGRKLLGKNGIPAKRPSRRNPTTPAGQLRFRDILPRTFVPRQAGNASFPTQGSQHLPANGYTESYTSQPKASSADPRQATSSFNAQCWNSQVPLNDSLKGQPQLLINNLAQNNNPQPQALFVDPPQSTGSIDAQPYTLQTRPIDPQVACASQPYAPFQVWGQPQPLSNSYAQSFNHQPQALPVDLRQATGSMHAQPQTLAPQSTPQDNKKREWRYLPESHQLGETVGIAVLPCVVAEAAFFQNADEKREAHNWLATAWESYWLQAPGTPGRAAVAWDILSFTRNYRYQYIDFVDPCPLFDDGRPRVCHEQSVCARHLIGPSASMVSVRP